MNPIQQILSNSTSGELVVAAILAVLAFAGAWYLMRPVKTL